MRRQPPQLHCHRHVSENHYTKQWLSLQKHGTRFRIREWLKSFLSPDMSGMSGMSGGSTIKCWSLRMPLVQWLQVLQADHNGAVLICQSNGSDNYSMINHIKPSKISSRISQYNIFMIQFNQCLKSFRYWAFHLHLTRVLTKLTEAKIQYF
jgi:hypothetical protein